MGKNRGSVENLGECGWWENWEIFGSLGSWVKSRNMEEVGKCVRGWGSVGEVWKSVWG